MKYEVKFEGRGDFCFLFLGEGISISFHLLKLHIRELEQVEGILAGMIFKQY